MVEAIIQVNPFPTIDGETRLRILLNEIEQSALIYVGQAGRPVVLVLDGVDLLVDRMPGALERIQSKAKFWADLNLVKVVFVVGDEETETILRQNSSDWSRAAAPIYVGDLGREDAVRFLAAVNTECRTSAKDNDGCEDPMTTEYLNDVCDLVGGRIVHLLAFKRDFRRRIPFATTADRLKNGERVKFKDVSRRPELWNVLYALHRASEKLIGLTSLVATHPPDDVDALLKYRILRTESTRNGTLVGFHSKLTERVVGEFFPTSSFLSDLKDITWLPSN